MRFYFRKVPNFVLGKLTRSISAESQILSNLTFDIVQGLAVPERITIRVPWHHTNKPQRLFICLWRLHKIQCQQIFWGWSFVSDTCSEPWHWNNNHYILFQPSQSIQCVPFVMNDMRSNVFIQLWIFILKKNKLKSPLCFSILEGKLLWHNGLGKGKNLTPKII